MILLDTSFLIELKKGNKEAINALEERKDKCEDILASSLTVYELLAGANYVYKKYGNIKELMVIKDILEPISLIPVDLDIVKKASAIKAEAMLKGIDIPDMDILIACTNKDAEILTYDRDFIQLKDFGFKVTVLGESNG